jgi:hypothetical protein
MAGIKGEWAEPCPDCGALDGCCATAKARLETGTSLTRLVDRQREKIAELEDLLKEKMGMIDELRTNSLKEKTA